MAVRGLDKFMQAKSETRTGLTSEITIVPWWAWSLALIVFFIAQYFFNVVVARQPNAPPAWARPLLGLALGVVAGFYLLFIGYINRDSKRRGMSPVLWTLVAVLVPNALGIILYFILRQPLRRVCPQCGNVVPADFHFCPRCSHKLSPSCPQCRRVVGANDVYCPNCGTSLRNQAAPASSPASGS
ncbi:MAG TPA: zinc ribbon domain-containing protein [Terriglobales bacterium]|nr:zinc ribbon domain-containing protein [Terriglobales bacterium]